MVFDFLLLLVRSGNSGATRGRAGGMHEGVGQPGEGCQGSSEGVGQGSCWGACRCGLGKVLYSWDWSKAKAAPLSKSGGLSVISGL